MQERSHQHTNDLGQPIGIELPDWRPPDPPSREPMEGRFCVVEPVDPDRHAEPLFESNAADRGGRSWTYLPYGPFETLEAYRAWLESFCRRSDPRFYAIVDRRTAKAAGLASYQRIDPSQGFIEVAHINFSPLLQRTPAATEAMYLMMDRVFALGYRP